MKEKRSRMVGFCTTDRVIKEINKEKAKQGRTTSDLMHLILVEKFKIKLK